MNANNVAFLRVEKLTLTLKLIEIKKYSFGDSTQHTYDVNETTDLSCTKIQTFCAHSWHQFPSTIACIKSLHCGSVQSPQNENIMINNNSSEWTSLEIHTTYFRPRVCDWIVTFHRLRMIEKIMKNIIIVIVGFAIGRTIKKLNFFIPLIFVVGSSGREKS